MFSNKRDYFYLLFFSLVCLAFPVYLIFMILHYGQNVPFWDEWEMPVITLSKFLSHNLHWQDLWASHNFHRIVLTRVIYLFNFTVLNGNEINLLWFQIVIQICLLLLLMKQLGKLNFQPLMFWLITVYMAAMVFAVQMMDVWFFGFLFQQTLTPLFFCATLFAISEANNNLAKHIGVMLLALLTTFASFNGLIIWPSLILMLFAQRAPWRYILFYVLVSSLVIFTYAQNLGAPSMVVHTLFSQRVLYALAFLGSIFSANDLSKSIHVGTLSLIIYVALWLYSIKFYLKKQPDSGLVWLMLGLLGVGSAILGALGRIDAGVVQALSMRYMPLAVPFWVGLFVALAIRIKENFSERFFLALALILLPIFTHYYLHAAKKNKSVFLETLQQPIASQAFALKNNSFIINPLNQYGYLDAEPRLGLQDVEYLHEHHLELFNQLSPTILGKKINKLGLELNNKPAFGTYTLHSDNPAKIKAEKYGFYSALYISGTIKVRDDGLEEIYISNSSGDIIGLALPDSVQENKSSTTWSGFVLVEPPAQLAKLLFYGKNKTTQQLFLIASTKDHA